MIKRFDQNTYYFDIKVFSPNILRSKYIVFETQFLFLKIFSGQNTLCSKHFEINQFEIERFCSENIL